MLGLGLQEILILFVIAVVLIIPYWKIFSKAGFSGWLSLTLLIPVINLAVPYYLAFATWPIHKKLIILEEKYKREPNDERKD